MRLNPLLITALLLVALAGPAHAHEEQKNAMENMTTPIMMFVTQVVRLEQQVVLLNSQTRFMAAHEHDHRKARSCLPRDFVNSQLAEMRTILEMISKFEKENVPKELQYPGAGKTEFEGILNGFREMVIICKDN